jgi:hypothetical protein
VEESKFRADIPSLFYIFLYIDKNRNEYLGNSAKQAKQAGNNLLSAITGAAAVATQATNSAVKVAGTAVSVASNVSQSGLKATGKLGTAALNVVGNTGSKAIRTTGAITNKTLNTTKRVTNASLNTAAAITESTAKAVQQTSAEVLGQATVVGISAAKLTGSAASAVTDILTRIVKGSTKGTRNVISQSEAQNELRKLTPQHFKDALITEYDTILASTVTNFSNLFKQYNKSFGDYIKIYKQINCAKGYLWGYRCSSPNIKADIKRFKDRVGMIGANFSGSLTRLTSSIAQYTAKINQLRGTTEELMTASQPITVGNMNQFTVLMDKTGAAFDKLFEDMSQSANSTNTSQAAQQVNQQQQQQQPQQEQQEQQEQQQRNKIDTAAEVAQVAEVAEAVLGGRRRTHKKKQRVRRHRKHTHRRR